MTQPTPHPAALEGAPHFADVFARIVGSLLAYIFPRSHALGPIAPHLHNRISRANRLIQRLMAHLADGSWCAPKPRAKREKPTTDRTPRPYISRKYGWLGQKYDYFIRGYFSQLEHHLNTPETLALLEAAPPEALRSLGRTLRPLCHIFGVTPPACLRLPPRAPKPRPRKPRKPRPRKLRLRTPRMPLYPTTSSTPWRIIRSKTQKFWG